MNPAPPVENFRLNAALAYAALGWMVFPVHTPTVGASGKMKCSCGQEECGSVGKHPRTLNGVKDATDDPDMIRAWWKRWPNANVAVAAGEGSGVFVVDVDPRHGGNESLQALEDSYSPFPPTVSEITGGDGLHFFFRHPGKPIKNAKDKLGSGLDVKSEGGYAVVAPSLHFSGNRYVWRDDMAPEDIGIADPPAWLMALLEEVKPNVVQSVIVRNYKPKDDAGSYWLGKALAKSVDGNRNDTGHGLACQLRDSGMPEGEAWNVMQAYQARVPQSGTPYTVAEARASLRSAYSHAPRPPARRDGVTLTPFRAPHESSIRVSESRLPTSPPPAILSATDELGERIGKIASGEYYNAPLPWPMMEEQTQALMPGSITVVCGDAGTGKTFWVLEALHHWHKTSTEAAVFFIEKDRVFHTQRLLAQLAENASFIDTKWINSNEPIITKFKDLHRETIDAMGKMIWSSPQERVTLGSLQAWIKQMASAGKRVIVIDPVSAVSAGQARWTEDDDFMLGSEKIITAHGCSLILVTHPKKGTRTGPPSGHDMAGGAAYFKFSDSCVWLERQKKMKPVTVQHRLGGRTAISPKIIAYLQKTRNGRGAGKELAYLFGSALKFAEQGEVVKEDEATDVEDKFA